jgi:SAM-dependent methyltransferase
MELRDTFDTAAELYDRARPGYPPTLFDDLVALSGIPAGGRVLEIGPGTGQATIPIAERGFRIVAVESGPELATVARRNLASFGAVEVQVGRFEEWALPAEPFDLVMAATAFHWIDPNVRLRKAAGALRTGGSLAVIATHHVAGGDEAFFEGVQRCYERFMPGTEPGLRLSEPETFADDSWGVDGSELFDAPVFRRYSSEIPYTTQSYLDVLGTYSGHIGLDAANRESLLGCISGLIEGRFGGRVRKAYLWTLMVARKR